MHTSMGTSHFSSQYDHHTLAVKPFTMWLVPQRYLRPAVLGRGWLTAPPDLDFLLL